MKKNIKNNNVGDYIFKYGSANYYYNAVMNNGMYEINNILNVKYNIKCKIYNNRPRIWQSFYKYRNFGAYVNNNITARCRAYEKSKVFF